MLFLDPNLQSSVIVFIIRPTTASAFGPATEYIRRYSLADTLTGSTRLTRNHKCTEYTIVVLRYSSVPF